MKKVAILAGGNSGEYEISLKTADNILSILDKSKFIPYLIHFKELAWSYTDEDGNRHEIDKNDFSLTIGGERILFDIVFIAIHGNPGEDGKIQGYFDMLNIPYTGCDLFVSALTFNKYFCNIIVSHLGVPVSPSLHFYKEDLIDYERIVRVCGFPCFVKPCNSGSSVGITKAHDEEELTAAILNAFEYDHQIMIEKYVPGREVSCGVATVEGKVCSLAITEIKSKKEYYDFEAKYTPGFLETETPAVIDRQCEQEIFAYSEKVYKQLGCKGVVRIDFIITPENIPCFLEINTIPGQTAMSIIPKQVQYLGMNLSDMYSELIFEALQA